MKEKITKAKSFLKERFVKIKNLLKDKSSKIKIDKRIALIVLISVVFIAAVVAASYFHNGDKNPNETTTEDMPIEELVTNQETINKLATVEKSINTAENRIKTLHPKVTTSSLEYYLNEVQIELEKLEKEGIINDFERNDTSIIIDLGIFYAYAPVVEEVETETKTSE